MKLHSTLFFLIGAAMLGGPAQAQLLTQSDLSLSAANALATAALSACQARGRQVVVSVLDRGGNLIVVQRADNVGPHNTEASRRKAYTALSTKSNTLLLSASARANPEAQNLATFAELLLLGGGVPLTAAGQVVGAIGVAGGGGAQQDHACALAAVAAVPQLDQVAP